MPYLLVLILLAILGGPWLVAAALALTGIWFAFVWTLAAILFAGLIVVAAFFVLAMLGTSFPWGRKKPKLSFGAGLDPRFKAEHECESGIYEEDGIYIVEINGKPNYFLDLDEARKTRDTGIRSTAEFSVVPKDHPSRRPV